MSAENDPSFWKLVAGGIVASVSAAWGGLKYFDSRLDKKADKEALMQLEEDVTIVRSTQAKIFDQIRENEQRAQDRYERLMEKL